MGHVLRRTARLCGLRTFTLYTACTQQPVLLAWLVPRRTNIQSMAANKSNSLSPFFYAGHMTIYVLVVALVSATGGMLFG